MCRGPTAPSPARRAAPRIVKRWTRHPERRSTTPRAKPAAALANGYKFKHPEVRGALAACAQITCQMVATAMGITTERTEITIEGDLDLRGTLGISKDVPVGFSEIRLRFEVAAPQATAEQLRLLQEKTEQYCVVMQTLLQPPELRSDWNFT